MNKQIILLPGDGIGKEIMDAAKFVLNTVASEYGHRFTFHQHAIGGDAYDQLGTPLPEDTINACQSADAVLLGAVEEISGILFRYISGRKRVCWGFEKH